MLYSKNSKLARIDTMGTVFEVFVPRFGQKNFLNVYSLYFLNAFLS
ncbi:hypothetical protein J2780_000418 [Chryseobacterium camelliae]|nr:hypothetical protein [Chryseobacterium camelliae]